MFLGHFAVAFAAKKAAPKVSLGTTIFAAQWLDLLWPALLLTGTETVALAAPGSPVPLSFTHYPLSHSLLAVLGWSMLFGGLYFLFSRNRRGAFVVGLLVLSHWVLDWLVHIPDLPIAAFTDYKAGLGLWNYQIPELVLELGLFAAGVYLFLQNRQHPVSRGRNIITGALVVFLLIIHIMNVFGPPPPDVKPIAYVGLSQWLLVGWGYWADKT
ncbi:MAG TPA: hypothetical protein VGE25_12395 [Sediminibacterium sp.]